MMMGKTMMMIMRTMIMRTMLLMCLSSCLFVLECICFKQTYDVGADSGIVCHRYEWEGPGADFLV